MPRLGPRVQVPSPAHVFGHVVLRDMEQIDTKAILDIKTKLDTGTILIIDDEKQICLSLKSILEDEGYNVSFSTSIDDAEEMLLKCMPSVILLDVWFGKDSWTGINFLEKMKKMYSNIPIIMISGHGNVEMAIRAMKSGAYDFIEKPFNMDLLLLTIKRAINTYGLISAANATQHDYVDIVHDDIANVQKATQSDSRVFIYGEKWTGKKELAKYIHNSSKRKNLPLVISYDLTQDDFAKVSSGTLVVADVSALCAQKQELFLSVIETKQFEMDGISGPFSGRIIACSTSQEIRKDLFNRLNIVSINVPSLSSRIKVFEDIVDCASSYTANKLRISKKEFSQKASMLLSSYNWKGNLKEFYNVIERAYIINCENQVLCENDISNILVTSRTSHDSGMTNIFSLPIAEARKEFESNYISAKIRIANGNVALAAKQIGMDRAALHRKIKSLNVKA